MSDPQASTTRQRAAATVAASTSSSDNRIPDPAGPVAAAADAAPHTSTGSDHRIRAAVSDSAKRQVNSYADIARDAVLSGAWSYPLYVG